eukprot:4552208-Pleurochrysis_carterae.AAC.1
MARTPSQLSPHRFSPDCSQTASRTSLHDKRDAALLLSREASRHLSALELSQSPTAPPDVIRDAEKGSVREKRLSALLLAERFQSEVERELSALLRVALEVTPACASGVVHAAVYAEGSMAPIGLREADATTDDERIFFENVNDQVNPAWDKTCMQLCCKLPTYLPSLASLPFPP